MSQSTALPLSYRGILNFTHLRRPAYTTGFFICFQLPYALLCKVNGILTLCMPKKKETRSYADRAEYIKKAVAKRRKKIRLMAIEYGGGGCQICGYSKCNRALSFHHKDPSKKDFGLSTDGFTRSWEKTKSEIDKCILVCANCHMEIHDGITEI
jgi:hypothetical protein